MTLQAALSPRLSACVHTLFTCLLFSLFSCCLPREPAALARGTCQACLYRTRSRYPGTCQLAPPVELVVECAQSSFHPPVLRVGDWHIILCSLAGLRAGGGGRGGRVFLRSWRRQQPTAVHRACGKESILCLGSSPPCHLATRSLPGLALLLSPHQQGIDAHACRDCHGGTHAWFGHLVP